MHYNYLFFADFMEEDVHHEEDFIEEEDFSGITGVFEYEKKDIPAEMKFKNLSIVIKLKSTIVDSHFRVVINLVGVLELKIIPHASILALHPPVNVEDPDLPGILLITYMEDIFEPSSYRTAFFTAIRKDLESFKKDVEFVVQSMKRRLSFKGPDLTPKISEKRKRSISSPSANPKKRKTPNVFKLDGVSSIVDMAYIESLRYAFPIRFKYLPWKLLFSMSKEGVSLDTLFSRTKDHLPLVMILLTDDKTQIGAFLPIGFKKTRGFYGTGETFVFRFNPLLDVYKWSRKNEFFTASSTNEISIGNSSQGGAAIYISEAMMNGFSDLCDTFDSPCLTTKSHFRIINLEVWHVYVPAE